MPRPHLRRRPAVALVAAALCGGWLPAAVVVGTASASVPGAAATDFRIRDDRVAESSGLVLSRSHPHTVWTANDSGDSARIFAVDTRTGRTTGVHAFGAPVTDVEGLAITPEGRVLVADIGDNARRREVVRVFWFDEPALGTTSGGWASWELAYPDGAHDAESIAVDPRTGRVVVVTKGAEGAVYGLPVEPSRRGVNRLQRLADAPATATDAVFLADGSALAVRTYTQLVLLDRSTWRPVARSVLPLQRQGETIALAPDHDGLLVGSEGSRSPVQQVTLPAVATSAPPTSDATPTGTAPTASRAGADAGAGAGADAGAGDAADRPPVDRAQLVAGVGGAVALVLVALVVVRLARRAQRR